MKLAIIDIGSNSIRMVLLQLNGHSYQTIDQMRHSVRLGQDMSSDGRLNLQRQKAAYTVLEHFARSLKKRKVDKVICIATEAVRRARNQGEFLSTAQKILGTHIRVLSGLEEAYYDYLGCVNTMDVRHALALDIGGSSTELILIGHRHMKESLSLPLGAIPILERFQLNRQMSHKNIEDLRNYLRETFATIPWLKRAKGLPIIGIGGSVRTAGKIDRQRKEQGSFIAHNYAMETQDLKNLANQIIDWRQGKGPRPMGLPRDREDLFLGSILFLEELCSVLGSRKIFVSGAGVRDGLMFEEILSGKKFVPDVLEFSLKNIIENHLSDDYDGEDLWQISAALLSLMVPHQPDLKVMGKVFKTATYLNDLGKNINFFQRDRNTFYSILNAPINGISQKQILLAACIATSPSADDILKEYLAKKMLTPRDISTIRKLGLLLKLAKAIAYGQLGYQPPKMTMKDGKLIITLANQREVTFATDHFSYHQNFFSRIMNCDVAFRSQSEESRDSH